MEKNVAAQNRYLPKPTPSKLETPLLTRRSSVINLADELSDAPPSQATRSKTGAKAV